MTPLVLLRHGESTANAGDVFAGHLDVPLTPAGVLEAHAAAAALAGWCPDAVHASPLVRASGTAEIVGSRLAPGVAVERHAALVERHYGVLQGLRRADARARFGAESVACWRRSPAGVPPGGESLEMLHERLRPYWLEVLMPRLESGRSVLVVAHGNSLRMLLAHVSGLELCDAIAVEIPTAAPLRPEVRLPAR
ncbi:2,3-bisphosphoglycerate-dependent phosphoglycerate mutase [Amycolatopsis sp. FDAARGOS 1241]|uniref:2,3-bisphosphoglycerate-dependent phosphoglycerate mutase n=1 Tax=Amycolatopsis sp. FDAARGOS 1241 TaxID=2778070 RepID=UPI00194DF2EC|nr:2,3-bisphosphoglycerate-dependent phosphoglycerate mutase [Amycolatopsis sp. FDAARGOS 1241]QRP50475.1 2,3-bisphosphoglycerate-dependent phosphoglycerate mutase [Amycolatopsis sp. FDAARGOS 1241]